jgi:hypothetical protein
LLAQDPPLRVEARIAKGTYYVGQGIDVLIGVVAEGERPQITAPRVDGAEVELIDTAFRPLSTSGIGDVHSESNAFITRYHVVPSRAWPLTIPPFVARLGERKGASTPIRLTIHPVPLEGRPASYLRGVGEIEARAEAVPASIRLGQTFEYRLVLKGHGAVGSTQWPVLPEFAGLSGLKIEPAGTDRSIEPPSRTYRYRARATEPGTLILPAVAVASFHPIGKRYVETHAQSVTVRVVDVPRFDPATLPAVPGELPSGPGLERWAWIIPAVAVAAAWGMVALVRVKTSARRSARRAARSLGEARDGDVAARVAAGLKAYLVRANGHRGGELTPEEAAREIARAVDDSGLAERARRLVERSDQARFGRDAGDGPSSGLAAEASSFFEDLARRRPRKPSP